MPPAYREFRPPAGLEAAVACLWENDAKQGRVQRVVPDGCLDLIWLADRELVIAGPDTGPRFVTLPARTRSSGIRLRPGPAAPFSVCRRRRCAIFHGSPRLAQTLIEHDLVDALHLMIYPVIVGAGKRLFAETSETKRLRLVESKTVNDGITILVYQRAAGTGDRS
jgi:hypothetical protein